MGNEIYGFDVDTLSWERIWGPTPNELIPTGTDSYETYLDGNPAARHTYDGIVYLPPPYDAMWEQGGSRSWNGAGTWATWQFNFGPGQWERKADAGSGWTATLEINAQYDPVPGRVIRRGRWRISEYDPAADTWTLRVYNGAGWWGWTPTSALDPGRRLMVVLGTGQLLAYNIDTHTVFTPALSGDTEIVDALAPGVAYDPVSDKLVAWMGGTDVYTLDLDTWVWTRIAAAPTNMVDPGVQADNGTFGRWQYMPSRNAFIVYNNVDENVFLYRLTPEPSSLLLLAAGVMPMLRRRRGC